jgi:hypothetical protein
MAVYDFSSYFSPFSFDMKDPCIIQFYIFFSLQYLRGVDCGVVARFYQFAVFLDEPGLRRMKLAPSVAAEIADTEGFEMVCLHLCTHI